MPEVHTVIFTIKSGRLETSEGRYTVVDGVVTLTDPDGNPVMDPTGKTYSHKLGGGPNDADAHAMAQVLARQLYAVLHGDRPKGFGRGSGGGGFNRPIDYDNRGIV
jgi:hypothetical protein